LERHRKREEDDIFVGDFFASIGVVTTVHRDVTLDEVAKNYYDPKAYYNVRGNEMHAKVIRAHFHKDVCSRFSVHCSDF
jgi:hypothetical protein